MKYFLGVFFLTFFSVTSYSQEDQSAGLLQLSGIVVSGDSLTPVPFTSIMIKGSSRGTICDYYGFFSLVVKENDTIQFSSVGYRNNDFVVPDTLENNRYSIIQLLQKDTIVLSQQIVYPWPSKEQFKQAFLTLDAPTTDYDRAFENMTREDVRLAIQGVPMSAQGNYNYVVQKEYSRLYNLGSLPQISLMNPLAWAQFIQAWKNGDFKSNK